MSRLVPTRWISHLATLVGLVLFLAGCGDITVAPDPFVCAPSCDGEFTLLTCGDGETVSDPVDCALEFDGNGACESGACVCRPSCDGLSCGTDGCEGSCGECGDGLTCASGTCVERTCTPGKGYCGQDQKLLTCDAAGSGHEATADIVDCAADFDGQGVCEADDIDEDGVPEDASCVCSPKCEGLTCGSDGCGGDCGTCGDTQTCADGNCVDLICTPGEPYCDGETQLFTCNEAGTGFDASGTATDCSEEHDGQGVCESEDWDDNGVPETAACQCAPACDGLNCGDDGCGGVCGECAETDTCDGGTCALVICTPGEPYCVDGDLTQCNDAGTGPAAGETAQDCATLFGGQGACTKVDAEADGVTDTAACTCTPACEGKGCWEGSGCEDAEGATIHCDSVLCVQEGQDCFPLEPLGLTLESTGDGCLLPLQICAEQTVECGEVNNLAGQPTDCSALVNKVCDEGFICEAASNDCLEVICESGKPYCENATILATCNTLGTGTAATFALTNCDNDGEACDSGACTEIICESGEPYCHGEVATTCNALGTGPDADAGSADCAAEATDAGQPIICVVPEDGPAACECQIQCDGKVCGDDACGGTCAPGCDDEPGTTCDGGQCELVHCTPGEGFCTEDGQLWTCNSLGTAADPEVTATDCLPLHGGQGGCEATDTEADGVTNSAECVCVPACNGKACGDDGCGDVCGTCGDDQVCDGDQQCVDDICAPESTYCDGDVVRTCDAWGAGPNPGIAFQQCDLQGPQIHCVEEDAGDGSTSAQCQCLPACDGVFCADDDGCGAPCSESLCLEGQFCFSELAAVAGADNGCHGVAQACGLDAVECGILAPSGAAETIDCADHAKVCDDGWICTETFTCECVAACEGRDCGQDHCGNDCGDNAGLCLGAQDICNDDGLCECVPACDGKECGPDGCGDVCGDGCGDATFCDEAQGLCLDQICEPGLPFCETPTVAATCNDTGSGADTGFFTTNCASLGAQFACQEGQCACVPNCAEGTCGIEDGCGDYCGCGDGEACHYDWATCVTCADDTWLCSDDGYLLACEDYDWSWEDDDWILSPYAGTVLHCADDAPGDAPEECVSHPQLGAVCSCIPQCDGKSCGPDGCGGTCGPECAAGQYCSTGGACEDSPCGACDDGDPCTLDECEIGGCTSTLAGATLGTSDTISGPDLRATHVLGGMAYVASGGDGLTMYDVTDPTQALPVGIYSWLGLINDVHADDNGYVYLVDESYGLVVVDASNVTEPEYAGAYDYAATWGMPKRLEMSDTQLWISDLLGARAYSVSDPTEPNPPVSGGVFVPDNGGFVWDVAVNTIQGQEFLFAANGSQGLVATRTGDLAFSESSHHLVYSSLGGSDVRAVQVVEDDGAGTAIAYVADRNHGLVIMDVSAAPSQSYQELGSWAFPDNSDGRALDVFVRTDKGPQQDQVWVYLAAGPAGLIVLNATEPADPSVTATYPINGSAQRVEADDQGVVFLSTGQSGIHILQETSCCIPDCDGKAFCSDDGCGGACGDCPDPDAGYCTGNADFSSPLGGACCYTAPDHPTNPGCHYSQGGYDSSCKSNQCADGLCMNSQYCSEYCSIGIDNIDNNTGANGADFIADPGQNNPCADFADGPAGTSYRCIRYSSSTNTIARCEPGTDFALCDTSTDCPNGESCRPIYLGSQYEARCQTDFGAGANLGEACNSEPSDGPLVPCNSGPFCLSSGACTDLCIDDESCATDVCVDGACSKDPDTACASNSDCSAMYCAANYKPWTDDSYTDDTCYPRTCEKVGDCGDPDWFCNTVWSGSEVPGDVVAVGRCERQEEGTADFGEPCGEAGDGTGLPPCVDADMCLSNVCVGPCREDEHCEPGTQCLLGAQWSIDTDYDGFLDDYLNMDVCLPWPNDGEVTSCLSDGDCNPGHHCAYRVKGHGTGTDRVWEVDYACKKSEPEQLFFPTECTDENKYDCSYNCVSSAGADTGLCSKPCGSASDCPDFNWLGQSYSGVCHSFTVNGNNTAHGLDDVHLSYCWFASSEASLTPCEETRKCDLPGEFCKAHVVASNADVPVTVDHVCRDSGWSLAVEPTKEVGEACSSYAECKSRSCLVGGPNGGYCGGLCDIDNGDADCQSASGIAGLKCLDYLLLDRGDPALSAVTQTCQLP